MKPIIGITLGDPAGVGPEVSVKAAAMAEVQEACRPVLIGEEWSVRRAMESTGGSLDFEVIESLDDLPAQSSKPVLLDTRTGTGEGIAWGELSPEAGRAGAAAITTATALAMEGRLAAIVTASINKEALHLAGFAFPGHTEMLAHLTGAADSRMLLVAEGLRVAHNSTHVSLRRACDLAKRERIVRTLQLFHEGLLSLGLNHPRIGVCGLNPHAGENGLFGEEDESEIAPAVADAKDKGWNVTGPFPADTLFARARAGEFDGVLAMYHDQGHIPVKTLGFQRDAETGEWNSVRGVNVSLGLPIIRTSVDHGTAFNIAGKGIARAESMVDAIILAVEMSMKRETN